MTSSIQPGPWQALPPSVAEVIEPELDAITEEIMATIAREVPEYARPFEGSFGRGVRTGVTEALRQFLALIRSPSGARGPGREVYVALGRGELVALLLREPPAEEADLRAAAAGTGWRLPRTAAAVAVPEEVLDRVASRLPADTLAGRIDGVGCAVVPDPEGPGRAAEIERALAGASPPPFFCP